MLSEQSEAEETHRLSQVPVRVVLLWAGQTEGGVEHRVEHTVVNQTVGLWIEALRGEEIKRKESGQEEREVQYV